MQRPLVEIHAADSSLVSGLVVYSLADDRWLRAPKRSPERLVAFARAVRAVARSIAKNNRENHFPARRRAHCERCDYRSVCPAWGNTPPAPDSPPESETTPPVSVESGS